MTVFLIVEANTPALVAKGLSGAWPFQRSLASLLPEAEIRLWNPYAAPLTDRALDGVDGVIFTGGGEIWCVTAPEVAPQRAAMDLVLHHALPVWGSCNGMQLAALALGAEIGPCDKGLEVGLAKDLVLTDAGRAHPMMSGRSGPFAVPCVHRDEIKVLPESAVCLASNAHTRMQAMASDCDGAPVWGTQYHPELGLDDIATYLQADGIFESSRGLMPHVVEAERDPEAVRHLGASPDDLRLATRTLEFANWLRAIARRRDQVQAA
ncbi:MAG: type 1 glutamine amidotransferase [Pseudomonadota bacterium]